MGQNQYFEDNQNLESRPHIHNFEIAGESFSFTTDIGVFSKSGVDEGTQVLLNYALTQDLKGDILDLGCGYGVVGIVLKRFYDKCQVTCCDVNNRALELTKLNQANNDCSLNTVYSDGFENIAQTFDAIITNPPIRVGKKVLYPLLEQSYKHLNEDGLFLAVVRRNQGAESMMKYLDSLYGNCEVVSKKKGYWVLKCIRNYI